MISPKTILTHLKTFLPQLTEDFTDKEIISCNLNNNIITVNKTNHNKKINDKLLLQCNITKNFIINVGLVTEGLLITLDKPHNLTLNHNNAILKGFTNNNINGEYDNYLVVSSNSFIIYGITTLPILTGNEYLEENLSYGINGVFEITKIIDINNYEIDLSQNNTISEISNQTIELHITTGFYIYHAFDIDKAKKFYDKNNDIKNALFLIYDTLEVSRSRSLQSDRSNINTPTSDLRLESYLNFSILAFIDKENNVNSLNAMDYCITTLLYNILKTLYGYVIKDYSLVLESVNFLEDSTSYIVAAYNFQSSFDIIDDYSYVKTFHQSTPLRKIYFSFATVQDGSNIILQGE